MKNLILVRHAKSSWSNSNLTDKDRPLNQRGRDSSLKTGLWLKSGGYSPDQVLSSSALRCRETWDHMAKSMDPVADATFDDRLYLASAQDMLDVLRAATGETVLMMGHMPGVGHFARELRRDPPPMHEMFSKYPTGAITVLEFRTDSWAEVQFGTAVFQTYVTPREI